MKKRKIIAHCQNREKDNKTKKWIGCEWRLHATRNKEKTFFQIVSFYNDCIPRMRRIKAANSTYYGEKYLDQMRDGPWRKVRSLQKAVKRDLNLNAN